MLPLLPILPHLGLDPGGLPASESGETRWGERFAGEICWSRVPRMLEHRDAPLCQIVRSFIWPHVWPKANSIEKCCVSLLHIYHHLSSSMQFVRTVNGFLCQMFAPQACLVRTHLREVWGLGLSWKQCISGVFRFRGLCFLFGAKNEAIND